MPVEFLKRLRPDGPWVLTAILPNRGQISTETFFSHEVERMSQWIEQYQNVRNIYYTLNSVGGATRSKPTKTQITELYALHCDCDPRTGEDLESERSRILSLLQTFSPKPSIIVDSGSGYQPIFLLDPPVVLDGTVEMAEEYERYNRQLELLLSGDSCFNVDRILRLPGTMNILDEKKIKKGRKPSMAKVVEYCGAKYSLHDFVPASTKIQTFSSRRSDVLPGGGEKIKLVGNIEPLYVDNLPDRGILVNDHIKALIIHGSNPEMKVYKSRSESLFAVVVALVRAGANDNDIASIILNKENKISESILDKPRPDQYAAKQIQNAREEVENPILRELNEKFAVIGDIGGKCRIISEAYDAGLKRTRMSFSSFEDFKNRFLNRRVKIGEDSQGQPVYKPAGTFWLQHPLRRQYDTIVFAPGGDIEGSYNLWRGFSCDAIPGDCSLFLEHIGQNLCKGNKEHEAYLLGWMARCVQQPDCQGEVAIVLRGDMGTGKSFFCKAFGSLLGRHYLQVSDPKHLVGSFNSHLRDCILILADEAFWAGDKKHESVLKSLITESLLTIEQKGIDVVASPNYTHVIIASNAKWVVPAGNNERRFFVLDVSSEKMQDKKYFAAMQKQLNTGGREALLYYLLNYDITNYEVREVPKTDALQDQKLFSLGHEESWWYEKLDEGRMLKSQDDWEPEIMKEDLQNDYVNFMLKIGILRKASATVLGKYLAKWCPGGAPRSYQKMTKVKRIGQHGEEYYENRRMYFYEIPNLLECRSHWDKHHGGPYKWSEPMRKEEQIPLPEMAEERFR